MKTRFLSILCGGLLITACTPKDQDIAANNHSAIYNGNAIEEIQHHTQPKSPQTLPKPIQHNAPKDMASMGTQYNDSVLAPSRPGVIVRRVAVPEKVVALTFDDGPHGKLTPQVLDILARYGAKGTFFVLGSNVASHPGVVRRMVNEGHEVANHTWSHAYLSKVSRDTAASQLQRTNDAIQNACGVTPVIMRPPGGYINNDVAQWMNQKYGFKTIMWDVDTNDWRKPGVQAVISRAVQGAKPGSIILVHDIHSSTVAAIEGIVKGLQSRGYRLVTVSELLQLGNQNAGSSVPVSLPATPATETVSEPPVAPMGY